MESEGEEEARVPKGLTDPKKPTIKEVSDHNLTHLPFRNWCPYCIKGGAPNRSHVKQGDEQHQVPQIDCDYCFMGDGEEEETLVIQVARDIDSKSIFAHAVPRKGLSHEHGADQLCRDIEYLGYRDIILKTDNEPAMRTLQEEIKGRRRERTILENSPVGESQSNGVVERAVRTITTQIRIMRLALQSQVGVNFSCLHPVTAWLVNHAADVINKFKVGYDGKTSYERVKGKPFKREVVEFGEKVFFRSGKLDKQRKMEPRWSEGIYLGMCRRTGSAYIGHGSEVINAHAIRRVPIEDRWRGDLLREIK